VFFTRSISRASPLMPDVRRQCFASQLNLDVRRTLAWGFAQAVLSVISVVEDGFAVQPMNPWIALAETIRPMLETGACSR
jgi:hypothetical protein